MLRLQPNSPLPWNSREITIGSKSWPADSHGLCLIFPNPFNRRKYIVLNTGHTFGEQDFKASNAWLFPRMGDVGVLKLSPGGDGRTTSTLIWSDTFGTRWLLPLTPTMQTSANIAPETTPAAHRTVLCLHGTRSMNRRVALFFECLQRDGFGIRVYALPRHRWIFDKSDAPLDLQSTGRCTAQIGHDHSASTVSAIFCFHWAVLPIAVLLGLLRRIPVIYDEHDHYELNTLEGSGPRLKLLLFSRCVRWIHRFCLPWVALVTCIHQAHSTLLLHLKRWQRNIVALHNYPSQILRNTVPEDSAQRSSLLRLYRWRLRRKGCSDGRRCV
ncbi:MAG UNVERIFIED_CONTAM: glycosyltransferase [Planctomycetaceae bacterium]|jgi:hypothetical protein